MYILDPLLQESSKLFVLPNRRVVSRAVEHEYEHEYEHEHEHEHEHWALYAESEARGPVPPRTQGPVSRNPPAAPRTRDSLPPESTPLVFRGMDRMVTVSMHATIPYTVRRC